MLDRLDTNNPLTLLAALIIGTIAVGRATRLAVHDEWPPVLNFRLWWVTLQANRDQGDHRTGPARHPLNPRSWAYGWGLVLECPFCFAPYAAAVDLTWVLLAGLSGHGFWSAAWWVVNVWAAVAYVAAILYARDQPAED